MKPLVPGAGVEPARSCDRGILSPLCLPISPPGQCLLVLCHQYIVAVCFCDVHALECTALLKAHAPCLGEKSLGRQEFCHQIYRQNNWRLGSESNRRPRLCRPLHNHSATQPLERETRFELATPTLARLCSTTELFPLTSWAILITSWLKSSNFSIFRCLLSLAEVINGG